MDYIVILSITIIIAVAIGFLLVHTARLSSQSKVREKSRYKNMTVPLLDEEALKKTISESIYDVVGSSDSRQRVSNVVSEIFADELNKCIETNTLELTTKHNAVIEQKTQSEEIAWKKYMKVLSGKKETDAVIRSIAEGLLVVDGKGNVVMMNPAAEKLLDASKKDKIGKPVLENLKKEQLISMVRDGEEGKDREIEIFSQEDETKRVLRSSSAVIENEDGQTVGMVSVLSDVTKQKELDLMKSRFVANVTHELRTPLVAIQKSIALLLGGTTGKISDTQSEFLALAERNLKKLGRLIDDLLDLAKLEAGKMQVKKEKSYVDRVIDDAVASLDTWAQAKSIILEKKAEDNLPQVDIDVTRVGQVLNNLIGNAIKFTPHEGVITISANLKSGGREIAISVKDTGPGIPQEDLEKVFDRFYQTGERTLTDISGTGVGLSIAKEITELHGGRIWVESDKGRGAKFIFTLPTG